MTVATRADEQEEQDAGSKKWEMPRGMRKDAKSGGNDEETGESRESRRANWNMRKFKLLLSQIDFI